MTDFRFPMETEVSYPPHVIPGAPWSWDVGGDPSVAGAMSVAAGPEYLFSRFDSAGVDRTVDLSTIIAGDQLLIYNSAGDPIIGVSPSDAVAYASGAYYGIELTISSGAVLNLGDRASLQIIRAPIPVGGDEPDPDVDPVDLDLIGDPYHEVAEGDTLTAIAAAWGVTVAEAAEANGLEDPDLIIVGTVLVRPNAPTPTDAQTKEELLAWLISQGVDIDKKAARRLTKAELLDLVEDVST